jgi:hypothetical protein
LLLVKILIYAEPDSGASVVVIEEGVQLPIPLGQS